MRLRNSSDIHRVLSAYSAMVYRLAYARTGSHADAEDISQEVFLALVRQNPDFPSEEMLRAWLIRVTVNKANSLWRTVWRRHAVLQSEVRCAGKADEYGTHLPEALERLRGDERTLIFLHYFEGLKTDEIADMLRRRPDTVRQQLSRARKKLKGYLLEEESQ